MELTRGLVYRVSFKRHYRTEEESLKPLEYVGEWNLGFGPMERRGPVFLHEGRLILFDTAEIVSAEPL
jgi:hypothetical protein